MSTPYADCAERVERLHAAVIQLARTCRSLNLAPLGGREWFQLLTQKLLPQLSDDAFLVVAVVGGTNIGKSVIFNHLAGCRASSTSPLASGTKHPVCLIPPGFDDCHNLPSIFRGFQLHEWTTSDAALENHADDRLFWRTSAATPSNLMVLDTPDIDSDAKVNWDRADKIRLSSDVLIAVLTQQKYNDAAVKQFFRKAAAEDKAVIVVFNQCLLPDDEQYWPVWLETFCRETGISPLFVYIAPNDRQAAEENRLPFYERTWPTEERPSAAEPLTYPQIDEDDHDVSRCLTVDLSQLRFAEIKVNTLRGSLDQLVHPMQGVPAYLEEVKLRSADFKAAADLLSEHNLAEIDDWPTVPNKLMVAELRCWWQAQRVGWASHVHGFYNAIGSGLTWPLRFARERIQGEQTPPMEAYRHLEWNAILETIDKIYRKLTWFSELGNELLQPRLESLLNGTSRAKLIEQLQQEHSNVDLDLELEQLVATEMWSFREESPEYYLFLKRLDSLAAAVRPVTSIVLFATGIGPVGDAAAQVAANTAIQSVVHVAGDVAGGTVAATVGETAISSTAASGAGFLEAKFRNLHATFTRRRGTWLVEMLTDHLLGTLPEELQAGAESPESTEFKQAQSALNSLEERLRCANER